MNSHRYRRLFTYNDWANHRLWDLILKMTDEQYFQASDYSIGSVHNQIVHTMEVEALYLRRIKQEPHQPLALPHVFPDRDAVRARWDEVAALWQPYVDALTDDSLDTVVEYTSITTGKTYRNRVWELLSQVLQHSLDHRSQTLAQMHNVGAETSALDFVFFTWEQPDL